MLDTDHEYIEMIDKISELNTGAAEVSFYDVEKLGDLANMMGTSASMKPEKVTCVQIIDPKAKNYTDSEKYSELVNQAKAYGATTINVTFQNN